MNQTVEDVFRDQFECKMIELNYSASEFEGFYAEGEWAYYSKVANCMWDAWCAGLAFGSK